MYEEMSRDLRPEERDAYLRRVGLPEEAGEPSKALLDRLVRAHQLTVPFENLSVCDLGEGVDLSIDALFGKVVTRNRGGYCFELNCIFASLLGAMGFQVRACLARVMNNRDYLPPKLHRVSVVTLDGEGDFFADVGFGGPMPSGSLPLAGGADDGGYYIAPAPGGGGEHSVFRDSSELLRFSGSACEAVDFIPGNFYCSSNPASMFAARRIVNLSTVRGASYLSDDVLTVVEDGVRTERRLQSPEELDGVLRGTFSIFLDTPLRLKG